MPLKREVIGLCDSVEPRARLLEAVNTMVIDRAGERHGYNTDVPGMVQAFGNVGVEHLDRVALVGAGATAASALAAVAELGAGHVVVLARSPERAQALVRLGEPLGVEVDVVQLDPDALRTPVDAVVSTIPPSAQVPLADGVVGAAEVVFDVIYHPRDTPFLTAATDRGKVAIGGFELLLHQAARQVELMTGAARAPIEPMRAAGIRAL
jgi:shikimate dehydrogenase